MSIQLSRRDFMKCSAVAVLAAASGTLLTEKNLTNLPFSCYDEENSGPLAGSPENKN